MNRQDINKNAYYKVLIVLRENQKANGEPFTARELAGELECSEAYVWQSVWFLEKEGKIARNRAFTTIRVTKEGFDWQPARLDNEEYEWIWEDCGHPWVASTPDFCMACRRQRNREAFKRDGSRYIVATMGSRA